MSLGVSSCVGRNARRRVGGNTIPPAIWFCVVGLVAIPLNESSSTEVYCQLPFLKSYVSKALSGSVDRALWPGAGPVSEGSPCLISQIVTDEGWLLSLLWLLGRVLAAYGSSTIATINCRLNIILAEAGATVYTSPNAPLIAVIPFQLLRRGFGREDSVSSTNPDPKTRNEHECARSEIQERRERHMESVIK